MDVHSGPMEPAYDGPRLPDARASRLTALIDLTRPRACIIAFLVLAVPSLAALCLIIAPFQTLDEAPHFYRSVQLADGHLFPVKSLQNDAAGDYLDSTVHKLGRYYQYLNYTRGKTSFGSTKADFRAAANEPLSGRTEFTPFSNTVIYFPLAHAAPALAILALKPFHGPPMQWLYAGRLLNSALAVLLFCLAIMWFPEGRIFVFALALLPRTLFSVVSLSPDALLIPFSALFGALVCRLARGGALTPWQYALLIGSTFFICVNKLAYIPLVAIPSGVALIVARRISRSAVILIIAAAATVLTWLIWMLVIRSAVFPIRHDVHIDVYEQLRHVISNPLNAIGVLVATLRKSSIYYLDIMVGGGFGAVVAALPKVLAILTYPFLVGAAVLAGVRLSWRPAAFSLVLVTAAGVVVAIFLLLYMQYTEVGAPTVDGVQGRYFLPLLPILIAFLPKFRISASSLALVCGLTFVWMSVLCGETIHLMVARYWSASDGSAPRYQGFSHADVE